MVLSFFQLDLSPPAGQMPQCHVNVFDTAALALFLETQNLHRCAHTVRGSSASSSGRRFNCNPTASCFGFFPRNLDVLNEVY